LVTVFIDTAVPMYAAGGTHPMREPCLRILQLVRQGDLDAVTSAEVVQEVVHRFLSVKRPEYARQLATDVLDLFAPVLPITHVLMRRVPELAGKYPSLQARDLVHVATCIHEGITDIVSPDRAFDTVTELRRIDPSEFAVEPA
jgi:predicted nucleic acid-binding protein